MEGGPSKRTRSYKLKNDKQRSDPEYQVIISQINIFSLRKFTENAAGKQRSGEAIAYKEGAERSRGEEESG